MVFDELGPDFNILEGTDKETLLLCPTDIASVALLGKSLVPIEDVQDLDMGVLVFDKQSFLSLLSSPQPFVSM